MKSIAPSAVITGAGSGIGRATATALSKSGYELVLVGRKRKTLAQTAALCGDGAEIVVGDVGDAGVCRAMVAQAVERFGKLDLLVNNAGTAPRLPIDKTTPKVIDEAFRVNALGTAYAIHAAWPVMVKQKGGCIINVSSMGTIDPFPGFFAYAASKAAVNLMAKSCAQEGAAHGIRAFAVAPGAVETQMLRDLFNEQVLPRDKCLSPEDVARVIVECAIGKRDKHNGQVIPLER
jgi:NAD(P)-dependent dehydrogenase (short-subunit alcohol dehydrogenase family)